MVGHCALYRYSVWRESKESLEFFYPPSDEDEEVESATCELSSVALAADETEDSLNDFSAFLLQEVDGLERTN